MNAAYDVSIDLTSATIGAVAGFGWNFALRTVRYRRDRAFWAFLQRPTVFVVGDLDTSVLLESLSTTLEEVVSHAPDRHRLVDAVMSHVKSQEISGLIGRGDLDAIVNMVVKFASLRLPVGSAVLHPTEVGDHLSKNLVLIGGRDVNSLTRAMSVRLGCQLEALTSEHGHNVVRDYRLQVDHPVTWQDEPNADGEILRVDYGVFARGRNPDNPESEVLIMAGAHGLGTLAAVEVALNSKFARRLYRDLREYDGNFECLVRYARTEGGPIDGRVTINLEFCRPIAGSDS